MYRTAGGCIWRHINEPLSIEELEFIPKPKSVVQYTKEGVWVARFSNAAEASRKTGISRTGICSVCNKKPKWKSAGGYLWEFESNVKRMIDDITDAL